MGPVDPMTTTPNRIRALLANAPNPPTHDDLESVAQALGRYPARAEWAAAGVDVPNLYASDGMAPARIVTTKS